MKGFISFFSLIIFSTLFKYNNNGYLLCGDHCSDCIAVYLCNSCEDHYYLSENSCKQCDSICKTCKNSSDECTSCYEGYYSSNKNCLKCDSNCTTCNNEVICTSCINNYFLFSNKCYQCNINCNTTNDGCKCDNCNDGYYLYNY